MRAYGRAAGGPRTSEHTRHDDRNNRLHHQLGAQDTHGGDWREHQRLVQGRGSRSTLCLPSQKDRSKRRRHSKRARTSYARLGRAIRRTEACRGSRHVQNKECHRYSARARHIGQQALQSR